ncbi:hypothetical protein [Actinoplanes regularis]|uniref:hypothetical protein n=1 Tax=Actinoplanes regularis TaxID=52697 RepID=UPI0024A551E7|nr:hypothetical protein [Actinoplanes regularis]GLW34522.1 hypothetical protein Areg01_74590 [Actinoplanes regularis]
MRESGGVGLKLEVTGHGRPGLAVHIAAGGRLLLRQGDQPVLLAKVFNDYSGVEYLVTDRFRSPIAPLRASHAATIADSDEENRGERWAHHFASALESARQSPLHDGSWLLDTRHTRPESTPWASVAAQRWTQRLLAENPGAIDWIAQHGDSQVLPLRRLSDATDTRVKSYRRQARAGILPPVLLWWISSLYSYVVLDGHDRILAAVAEDQWPSFIALAPADRRSTDLDSQEAIDRHLAERQRIQPGNSEALVASGRRLARMLNHIDADHGRTRAWMLPGGGAAWDAVAQAHAPGWLDRISRFIDSER